MRELLNWLNVRPNAVLWGLPTENGPVTVLLPETAAATLRTIAAGPEVEHAIATFSVPPPSPFRWHVYFDPSGLHVTKAVIPNSPGGQS
jgi:hypothetical protein